ncbi:hypothetical protein Vqi01_58360 [Micromonospora qiuiae]|uniref:Uncharacterized protein n=1 Tax=Micromonospora qiuiae TaxID=502268 RepID=A0ABQ4JMF0_9ACTN|nr:hypothetical protein [Micromonospora qiuiae]GIJ30674.1 hypothetical protein Vqi01_58360 [Micromonospora qiuiae]
MSLVVLDTDVASAILRGRLLDRLPLATFNGKDYADFTEYDGTYAGLLAMSSTVGLGLGLSPGLAVRVAVHRAGRSTGQPPPRQPR